MKGHLNADAAQDRLGRFTPRAESRRALPMGILTPSNSSPAFAGEGDRPQAGGGAIFVEAAVRKRPSTMLRMVPLPRKAGGG